MSSTEDGAIWWDKEKSLIFSPLPSFNFYPQDRGISPSRFWYWVRNGRKDVVHCGSRVVSGRPASASRPLKQSWKGVQWSAEAEYPGASFLVGRYFAQNNTVVCKYHSSFCCLWFVVIGIYQCLKGYLFITGNSFKLLQVLKFIVFSNLFRLFHFWLHETSSLVHMDLDRGTSIF
jgi:hypothetical protein